ncbi:MAG: ribonuclease III, partial [Myxococcota bacterium]
MPNHSDLARQLGIDVDTPRLDEALTHPSYVNEHPGTTDYQRLEFLGDAVLGLCVTEILLAEVPRAREGRLTRMRASLVNTEALAAFARDVGLVQWVRFGRGAASSRDAHQPKVLADVVEAIVAAVYLHRGMDGARALTRRLVGESIRGRTSISRRDPKSELQERVQRHGGPPPVYEVVSMRGPEHEHSFEVEVRVDDDVLGRGQGRSKKLAEQQAA